MGLKRGFNLTVFWSIIFLILIVITVLAFFFLDTVKPATIHQESLNSNEVSLEIRDFKIRSGGVEFILMANPREKEITGIIFTFETFSNKSENYFSDKSYVCKTSEEYSIDLKHFFPKEIAKIKMEPLLRDFDEVPRCLPDANVDESLSKSKEKLRNFFSRFSKK